MPRNFCIPVPASEALKSTTTSDPLRLPSVQTTCSGCSRCTVVCTLVRLCGGAQDTKPPLCQCGKWKTEISYQPFFFFTLVRVWAVLGF
uniref:Uncharacterized protein n=1 Tax=Esox lucius TaxID=8010 RepID=A0AAY5KH77_ESOLU